MCHTRAHTYTYTNERTRERERDLTTRRFVLSVRKKETTASFRSLKELFVRCISFKAICVRINRDPGRERESKKERYDFEREREREER